MPAKKGGYPSLEKFPYFWCNSSGQEVWRTRFPFNATEHCQGHDTFNMPAVAHARVEQRGEDGAVSKSTKQSVFAFNTSSEESKKWFSWFELPIECGCNKFGTTDTAKGAVEKKSVLAIGSGCPGQAMETSHQCHQLSTKQQEEVGSVCIEIAGSPPILEVTYKASNNYAFTRTDFWFDSSITTLPLKSDGAPDVDDFGFFWRNSSGESVWSTRVPMYYYFGCSTTEDVHMSMVAHAGVARRFDNGTLDFGSGDTAFAYGLEGQDTTMIDAAFDFTLQCQCAREKSAEELSAPLSSLQLPASMGGLNVGSTTCPNRIAWADKQCFNVTGTDETSTGKVCAQVVGNPPTIMVTRDVSGDWVLLKSKFWYGTSAADVPKRKSGRPDIEKFPYFWGNSSGEEFWTGSAILENSFDCRDASEYAIDLVAHSTYMKKFENGTLIHGSKEASFAYDHSSDSHHNDDFGWIPLKIGCKCTTQTPKLASTVLPWMYSAPSRSKEPYSATKPQPYCIDGDNGSGRECHNMMVGDSATAGSLCVEAVDDSEYFEFTFQSTDEWTLLTTELWLGDSIEDVPTSETEDVNNNQFPYFFRNSTGQHTWKTKIALNVSFDCSMIDEFKMAIVASSTFGKVAQDGSLIDDTEVVAFVEDRPDSHMFGWFGLGLRCNCGGTLESLVSSAKAMLAGDDGDKSCVSTSIFIDEDFEDEGSEDAWDNGVITKGSDFTYFLGRLGGDYVPEVSRSFSVPTSKDGQTKADSISLEFVLYIIDEWKESDAVRLTIGSDEVNLGPFANYANTELAGSVAGISWRRTVISHGQNLGFGEAMDEKHLVQIAVPADHFDDDYSLFFGVKVALGEDAENSAGIDDLMIEAHYACPTDDEHRDLKADLDRQDQKDVASSVVNATVSDSTNLGTLTPPISDTVAIPDIATLSNTSAGNMAVPSPAPSSQRNSEKNEGESLYCLAEDFPCGSNADDVYVCHYSRMRGHQTLCIPEEESHILRYYPQDYCGPCVGSFAESPRNIATRPPLVASDENMVDVEEGRSNFQPRHSADNFNAEEEDSSKKTETPNDGGMNIFTKMLIAAGFIACVMYLNVQVFAPRRSSSMHTLRRRHLHVDGGVMRSESSSTDLDAFRI
ncbi:expressed unknown protein [Seminavis robusta]|uniref:Uncharacterized protein n=1 Tax=Seminavis robusta TaxID=568900 RepID=A0A9N8HRL3_9STRA|nr:expressed unknown protein [Seminavis robusta]|eukprot:Sro1285_g259280.1 n/a (1125) ;mRNA; f:2832-6206